MDIDSLFKVPKLPPAGSKRKMPDNPTPEMLKKMKIGVSPAAPSSMDTSLSKPRGAKENGKPQVTVEDEGDEEMDGSFAPGGDADYFAEEDDEGRFFGGGLTSEQKEILNIFDNAPGEDVQENFGELTITSIRRLLLQFERAANKNQDQRSKYPNDPTKFIDSEADLDGALKALLPLAQAPVLAYPELVRSGAVNLLIGLLSHENADIVIDVVEVVHELTDEDAENDGGSADGSEEKPSDGALKALIEALLENSILELLVDNLARLNEEEEADKQGVFHILGIFENILGFNPELSTDLVSKTRILPWLLERIQSKTNDGNRVYAAEIISILLQNNSANQTELGKKDGIEIILKVLSQYRRRDPVDADETEFMENLFDALCSGLSQSNNKALFVQSEGVDLMVLMMKEKLVSRSRALKTLDYALLGADGAAACDSFVEVLGLKTLFSTFMGTKTSKTQKASGSISSSEENAHILGIICSLLSNLDSDSPARIRLLTKFVESNYAKADKLLEMRDAAVNRLRTTDAEITEQKRVLAEDGEEITPEDEYQWYLLQLEGGLFTLQSIDYILGWLCMEDDGVRAHVVQMLDRKNQTLKDVVATLQIYHENIGNKAGENSPTGEGEDMPSQKEVLKNLIAFLETC